VLYCRIFYDVSYMLCETAHLATSAAAIRVNPLVVLPLLCVAPSFDCVVSLSFYLKRRKTSSVSTPTLRLPQYKFL